MAKKPSQPQQGGSPSSPQQQTQQAGSNPQQQGSQPIFRDWASI